MIALESLPGGTPTARNFEKLMSLILDTGGVTLGMRIGNVAAIAAGTLETVAHGLGKVPSAVFTQAANGDIALGVDLVGATTFRVANASATNTACYWIVIG